MHDVVVIPGYFSSGEEDLAQNYGQQQQQQAANHGFMKSPHSQKSVPMRDQGYGASKYQVPVGLDYPSPHRVGPQNMSHASKALRQSQVSSSYTNRYSGQAFRTPNYSVAGHPMSSHTVPNYQYSHLHHSLDGAEETEPQYDEYGDPIVAKEGIQIRQQDPRGTYF